jgi:6-phosphogluconolactonase
MICRMQRIIQILPDVPSIVGRAAEMIATRIRSAIAQRGRCTFALSGGTSVGSVFDLLVADAGIEWSKVFLFWGDDRFVDQSNPYSSYKLAEEKLLTRAPGLPRTNVFPVPVSAPTPAEGAKRYSQTIRQFFDLAPGQWPRFDLAINGMGPDGHTASLFPHSAALEVQDEIAVMNHAGLSPWVDRVTLTFPVFNHARCVLFMASGSGKARTLKTILEGERDILAHPTQGIAPADGAVIWLLEPSIATQLDATILAAGPGERGQAQ